MERFCKNLKEHATKIINYEEIEMIPLTDEENLILIKMIKMHLNYTIK